MGTWSLSHQITREVQKRVSFQRAVLGVYSPKSKSVSSPPTGERDFTRTAWNREGNGTPLQYPCLENPMDGGAYWLQSMGSQESDMTEQLHFHFSLSCIGEGNGNPLQCSCLENPRDRGAWWAAVCGVAQSWTRLKRLSSSRTAWKACFVSPTAKDTGVWCLIHS